MVEVGVSSDEKPKEGDFLRSIKLWNGSDANFYNSEKLVFLRMTQNCDEFIDVRDRI